MENVKVDIINLDDDMKVASDIIDNKLDNNSYNFDINSPIYKTTNETISHKEYIDALSNREKVLSVIGSGDQIINSILFGGNDITGVDISRFAKYFVSLKLSAIKTLSKEEYLDYFYSLFNNQFSIKYYNRIRNKLDCDTRLFWDYLYLKYDANVLYNSSLFQNFNIHSKRAIINNPFLNHNNYDLIKQKLDNVSISLYKYDIFDIKNFTQDKYDLIILSNLINAINYTNETMTFLEYKKKFLELVKVYKEFLHTLPLKRNGIAITYNLPFYPEIKDYFNSREYQVYKVEESLSINHLESEILIYKKRFRP